ncbi:hypothetical protein HPB48_025335 [Haemaphysalis longicornis]|uniref:Uncharacterized protein n=1 Tax=Haemaphysalis longicornis TaxID=44386 RepID=A0A9J6H968_HAELO|nr:hypothetical protein HPB48_025335 [Haemaphysalis longicornis]
MKKFLFRPSNVRATPVIEASGPPQTDLRDWTPDGKPRPAKLAVRVRKELFVMPPAIPEVMRLLCLPLFASERRPLFVQAKGGATAKRSTSAKSRSGCRNATRGHGAVTGKSKAEAVAEVPREEARTSGTRGGRARSATRRPRRSAAGTSRSASPSRGLSNVKAKTTKTTAAVGCKNAKSRAPSKVPWERAQWYNAAHEGNARQRAAVVLAVALKRFRSVQDIANPIWTL